MVIGTRIQNYTIIAAANKYVMGKSPFAPSPYAVWEVDDDGEGVCCGHYFVDREEAEWDFCSRAFEWFDDNMYVEDKKTDRCDECKYTHENSLADGLRAIRTDMAKAAQLVSELCAEVDKFGKERTNGNSDRN